MDEQDITGRAYSRFLHTYMAVRMLNGFDVLDNFSNFFFFFLNYTNNIITILRLERYSFNMVKLTSLYNQAAM